VTSVINNGNDVFVVLASDNKMSLYFVYLFWICGP